MRASMSGKGNCYDNAPMESFWGTLKTEHVFHRQYETRQQAMREITEYIEIFSTGNVDRSSSATWPRLSLNGNIMNCSWLHECFCVHY